MRCKCNRQILAVLVIITFLTIISFNSIGMHIPQKISSTTYPNDLNPTADAPTTNQSHSDRAWLSKTATHFKKPDIKILVTFIATGSILERSHILKENLKIFDKRTTERYVYECMIFVYASFKIEPTWFRDSHQNHGCTIHRLFESSFVMHLKTLIPQFLGVFDYVTIVMDDVALVAPHGTFELDTYFDIVVALNLSVSTPSISNSKHQLLWPAKPESESVGRIINMIEIQAITYRMDAWTCQYELIDTEYPSGWGLDIWYQDYCKDRVKNNVMGVLDIMHVKHNPLRLESTNNPDSAGELMNKQVKAWKEERNITLLSNWPIVSGKLIFDQNLV